MSKVVALLLALGVCLASTASAKKSLLVDLAKSTVYAFDDGRMVRALTINPGAPGTPTRTGHFRISQKVRKGYRSNLVDIHNRPLKKGGLGAPMDYWMRLGGTGMGFHRSSLWRPSGRWGSHGCLRMSRAGARWLFEWAPMGTPVEVVSRGAEVASAAPERSHRRTLLASKARKRAIVASSGMAGPEKGPRVSSSGREARRSGSRVAGIRAGSVTKPAIASAKGKPSVPNPAVAAKGKPSVAKPAVAAGGKAMPAQRPPASPASPPAVAAQTEKAPPSRPAGSEPSLAPIKTVTDESLSGPERKKG